MNRLRLHEISSRFRNLRILLIGDFCLDRYFEIDPALDEKSIETGRTVHNVTRVRLQPGAAGTILNNMVALGVGSIRCVGACGDDPEGWALQRALASLPGVDLSGWVVAPGRATFTYSKPLVRHPNAPPEELDRLDQKNWVPTPETIQNALAQTIQTTATVDAIIVLDQVDKAETGVITSQVLSSIHQLSRRMPRIPVIADSRRGLRGWPPFIFKMNATECRMGLDAKADGTVETIGQAALEWARRNQQPVIVTLSERGILGALPDGSMFTRPALPVTGPIDIVGAGDAVTANLATALGAGATLSEALEMAMAAASCVIHQLGTTGVAGVPDLEERLVKPGT